MKLKANGRMAATNVWIKKLAH